MLTCPLSGPTLSNLKPLRSSLRWILKSKVASPSLTLNLFLETSYDSSIGDSLSVVEFVISNSVLNPKSINSPVSQSI